MDGHRDRDAEKEAETDVETELEGIENKAWRGRDVRRETGRRCGWWRGVCRAETWTGTDTFTRRVFIIIVIKSKEPAMNEVS